MIDPRARVGDADREQAVADLQRYAAEGYLTLDEFADRSAAAYRATTHGELATVTQDLTPEATTHRDRHPAGRGTGRISSRPVAIAIAVVVVVVLAVGVMMAMMMLGMMGGMDMGGMR